MSSDLRRLAPEDAPALRALEAIAFSQGRAPEPEETPPTAETIANSWGVFEDGTLRSALSVVPFQVHWTRDPNDDPTRDTLLPMGGIAGVATAPEARGRGHVDALLRQSLVAMREAGQVVSALYPFAWSFYRKFGWDWVGERCEVTIPLTELKKADEGRDVVRVTGDDYREKIGPAYTAYARQFRGTQSRETHKWEAFGPSDRRQTLIYQYPPTGEYLAWQYESDGGRGRIREWAVWTPEGHRAMLSLLHYLSTQCDKATVTLPADNLLPQFVMHWDMKVKTSPVFAARIVDVAAAFNALGILPEAPNGSLSLAVRDPYAPWNDGVHHINVEGGTVRCTTTRRETNDAGLSVDIQTLSQAFWGSPSLPDLQRAGRVEVRSEADFRMLTRLLGRANVFTMDFF